MLALYRDWMVERPRSLRQRSLLSSRDNNAAPAMTGHLANGKKSPDV
jgi:hypothetical protein